MLQTVNQCFACELIDVGKWQNSHEFMCFKCMDQYELTIVKDVYPQPEEMCKPQLQNGMALRLATTSKLRENAATTSSVRLHLMKTEQSNG